MWEMWSASLNDASEDDLPQVLLPLPFALGEATFHLSPQGTSSLHKNFLVFETAVMKLQSTQTQMCKWKNVQNIHFCVCSSVNLRDCWRFMIV